MDIMKVWFGDYDNKYPVNSKRKDQRKGENNKTTVKVKVTVCSLTKTDESLTGWIRKAAKKLFFLGIITKKTVF